MNKWLHDTIFLMPNMKWVSLVLFFLLGILCARIMVRIVGRLSHTGKIKGRIPEVVEVLFDPAVRKSLSLTIASLIWLGALDVLNLPQSLNKFLFMIVKLILAFGVLRVLYQFVDVMGRYMTQLARRSTSDLDEHLVALGVRTFKFFTLVLGVLILLQNIGFNVFSLLAGLGLGGLAFALAAKDTASNLFGSVTVLIDKSYKIGDWIVVDNAEGLVEEIGLRSTRLRTATNSLVTIPNSIVAMQKVDNLGVRPSRRILTELGITYDTAPQKIEMFCEALREVIRNNPVADQNSISVSLKELASFSLNVRICFYVKVFSADAEHTERHRFNIQALEIAKKLGIDYAYPTQTVLINPPAPLV
jgi:MscS family membrane protein